MQHSGHEAVEIFQIREMFPVRIVKNPVELQPLGDQLGQFLLPPPETEPHVALPLPAVPDHLLVHRRVRLDDDVQARLVRLQGRVDDAQAEADVQHAPLLGAVVREDAGVRVHEGAFPFHHDGVVVVVEEQGVGGVVAHFVLQVVGFGAGFVRHGDRGRCRLVLVVFLGVWRPGLCLQLRCQTNGSSQNQLQ